MAHQRRVIRHAATALLTNATAAGDRVKAMRIDPLRKLQLPAIGVWTLSEETDPDDVNTAPRELRRELKLMIEGTVADSAALPVDDAMDDLAEQIEAAMDGDFYLGGAVGDSKLVSTDLAIPSDVADPLVGVVTLTYVVTYHTFVGATTPANDYLRTGTTTHPGGGNVVNDLFNQRVTP